MFFVNKIRGEEQRLFLTSINHTLMMFVLQYDKFHQFIRVIHTSIFALQLMIKEEKKPRLIAMQLVSWLVG